MILLQPNQELDRVACEALSKIRFLVEQQKRFGLLLTDTAAPHAVMDALREDMNGRQGQFLTLDAPAFGEASLSSLVYAALGDLREGRAFRINLPMILQNNPNTDSPFINRAILWQRLCDAVIEDEQPTRPTLLVLEGLDRANRAAQHDLARLIRFHVTHRIHRTFLATLHRDSLSRLSPELRELVDLEIEIEI